MVRDRAAVRPLFLIYIIYIRHSKSPKIGNPATKGHATMFPRKAMKEIIGAYGRAKCYATIVDEATEKQIKLLCDQPFTEGLSIAIMPDCHAGKGCVIGTTMTIKDKIVPNLVGVDISCGMLAVNLGPIDIDLASLDEFIHAHIPSGFFINEEDTIGELDLTELRCYDRLRYVSSIKKAIGSLGGGNHFIEVDVSENGDKYLVIHTGSRNLGKQVAEIYQRKAIDKLILRTDEKAERIKEAIARLKEEGRQREIPAKIEEIKKEKAVVDIPEELCYVEGKDFEDYIHDSKVCAKFASANRHEIARRIHEYLGVVPKEIFETVHNYIDTEAMILRKGAISAKKGEKVIVPVNMRDGSIIAIGKGNPDYNFSGPHGAGRVMSRKQAMETISLDDFKKTMEGIYSTSVAMGTLDESPFAYKPIEAILPNIADSLEMVEIIKPIYNFKAGAEGD